MKINECIVTLSEREESRGVETLHSIQSDKTLLKKVLMDKIDDLDTLYTVCTRFCPPIYSMPFLQLLVFSVDS